MSLGRFVFSAISSARSLITAQPVRGYHAITSGYSGFPNAGLNPGPWNCLMNSVRTKIRNYWPRPNEVRRIRRHGWIKRMSTPEGRKIIMRRILKGRYVLSH